MRRTNLWQYKHLYNNRPISNSRAAEISGKTRLIAEIGFASAAVHMRIFLGTSDERISCQFVSRLAR